MAEKLTEQQAAVVENRGGKLLVSAAAGSGKTKVLVDRLLLYLTDPVKPANIDDFLIITFTKAAASELRGKIAEKLSQRIAEDPSNTHLQQQLQRLYMAKISTVHSFCGDILREYAYKLDLSSDFRIIEPQECARLKTKIFDQVLEQAYSQLHTDPDLQAFMETQGLKRNDAELPQILDKVLESARCHSDPMGWLDWCLSSADTQDIADASETVWGSYLIDDFHHTVAMQISGLEKAIHIAKHTESFEKVVAVLESDYEYLNKLKAANLWQEIVDLRAFAWLQLVFPRKTPYISESESIKFVRNTCKDTIKDALGLFADDSDSVLEDLQNSAAASRGLIKLVKQFDAEFQRKKHMLHVMDYTDLEHGMLDLLLGKHRTGPTAAARDLGERFREIMVDEYQDTNEVQDTIFSVLSQKKNHCFMVGDVKQSIYQFRLADPTIFLNKYNSYAHAKDAAEGEPRKIILSKNFRSSQQVINAVNDSFRCCMSKTVGDLDYGESEMLYLGLEDRPRQQETEIELLCLQTAGSAYSKEAELIAERVSELLDGSHTVLDKEVFRPIIPDDIAILLRSPKSNGPEIMHALQKRGIRCAIEKSGDILQTEEVGTLLALLQTVHNPLQDIPLAAVLSSRVFGFTADMLARIRAAYKQTDLYTALQKSKEQKVTDFLALLQDLRQAARNLPIGELTEYILAKTAMDSIYASMEDGISRLANIQSFCSYISGYSSVGDRDLSSFITHISSFGEKGLELESDAKPAGTVSIYSIHKSKGLEYPVVILGCLSREFNDDDAQKPVLCHKDLGLGLNCVDTENRVSYPTLAKKAILKRIFAEALSEEMRILYVAMTRARDRLIMTYANKFLQGHITKITSAMNVYTPEYITSSANCPGKWILYTALQRTEAGELFNLGGKPEETQISVDPWIIRAFINLSQEESEEFVEETSEVGSVDPILIQKMQKHLSFAYPYAEEVDIPSKQTATQLKGRVKDQEAAEETQSLVYTPKSFRNPSFSASTDSGVFYGNAIHTAMQYVNFAECKTLPGVEGEIQRLLQGGHLTAEQARAVNCDHIFRFFQTSLGKNVMEAKQVLREFKFSILEDAKIYYPKAEDGKILMQGVVDCAIIEDDGVTVLDFKSDYVPEGQVTAVTEKYRLQVSAYARAIAKIFQKPIKRASLYFFRCNETVDLDIYM